MLKFTRRTVLGSSVRVTIAHGTDVSAAAPAAACEQPPTVEWVRGIEGQRKADLGNGTFLNPIAFPAITRIRRSSRAASTTT